MTDIRATPYQIFKKSAAARFTLEKPKEEFKVGCIYMQVAPSKGKVDDNNTYDWENKKISVKFGINDISKLNYNVSVGLETELFHDFNDSQKMVKFTPKEGGGFFLQVTEVNKSAGTKQTISVPISQEEASTLASLFFHAIPLIHNWR